MRILVVSATDFEILPLIDFFNSNFSKKENGWFEKKNLKVKILVTGVGVPLTVYKLTKELQANKFDLVLNLGIAGAISRELELGEVVEVVADRFADIGVEEKNGTFTDVFEMELIASDSFPFKKGELLNSGSEHFNFIKKVRAITVNKVHGTAESIEKIKAKYPTAEIESMEGAAVALVGESEQSNYLQIRAISNYVEPRNRERWKIKEAIMNLNVTTKKIFEEILKNL